MAKAAATTTKSSKETKLPKGAVAPTKAAKPAPKTMKEMLKAKGEKAPKAGKVVEPMIPVLAAATEDEDSDDDMDLATGAASSGPSLAETTSGTSKNFRNHPDMENFFRFIYENDLREEALEIIDQIMLERESKKKKLN